MISGCSTSWTCQILLRLYSIYSKLNRPWYEIASWTITLGVQLLCHLIMHFRRQHWLVQHLTCTQASWFHKLKRYSSEKTTWFQLACITLCLRANCRCSYRWFKVKGILHKSILTGSPLCSTIVPLCWWIDKTDIRTTVAVDQRAANCMEEAVLSFTAMQSRCWLLC